MKNIYRYDGKYYRLVKRNEPFYLWQPVKKFLWFYVNCGSPFLLDGEGFHEISSITGISVTNRGFNNVDLVDKYGANFYIKQSSGNLKDVWLGITTESQNLDYKGNKVGDEAYAILIDDETWKAIKRARRLCRK